MVELIVIALVFLTVFTMLSAAVENEVDFFAVILTVILVALACFISAVNPISWVWDNFVNILLGAAGWVLAGGLWAILKWRARVNSEEAQNALAESFKSYQSARSKHTELNMPSHMVSFEAYLDAGYGVGTALYDLGRNKGRIGRWIVWWPASLYWSLTWRLIVNLTNAVYNSIRGILVGITASAVKKAKDSVPASEPITLNEQSKAE